VPPLTFHLGDAPHALPVDPQQLLDHHRPGSRLEQALDRGRNAELVLPHAILGLRLSKADHLADEHEKVDRNVRLGRELLERHAAERGEPLVEGAVHEGERDVAVAKSGGDAVERHPAPLQGPHQAHPGHVTQDERLVLLRPQDPKLDESADVVRVHASPVRDILG
jgi:hypothetical protein